MVPAAEALYGKGSSDADRWSRYWHRRLKQFGAGYVVDHLSDLASRYAFQPAKQREILKAIRFLRKHQPKMDFPRYVAEGLPIGSGPMESFSKQLGQRLKGAGMRWNLARFTPMAMLVSNWCTIAKTGPVFGAAAAGVPRAATKLSYTLRGASGFSEAPTVSGVGTASVTLSVPPPLPVRREPN